MSRDEMPILGIIGCTVFTDELAYLLARDHVVNSVVVIDNPEGRKLAGKVERSRACESVSLVEWERLGFREYDDDEIVIWMNSTEMHNSQERMRNAMTSEIMMLSGSVDCILLLYGQCRCQTLDVQALEDETGIPIIYLTDRQNVIVDDCISAVMGSSARYLEAMKQHKGAFFLTPGYVDGFALKFESKDLVELMDDIERMDIAFDYFGRPPLIKLDPQINVGAEYHDMITMFARTFDLEVKIIHCTMAVFEDSYDWACSVMRAGTVGKEPIVVMAGQDNQVQESTYDHFGR